MNIKEIRQTKIATHELSVQGLQHLIQELYAEYVKANAREPRFLILGNRHVAGMLQLVNLLGVAGIEVSSILGSKYQDMIILNMPGEINYIDVAG